MNQEQFTAKANKVEQDTGFELMGVYDDADSLTSHKTTEVYDDGFMHFTIGAYRASFDIDSMDSLTPEKQRQAKQKLRQAWYDDSDLQPKVEEDSLVPDHADINN